jgi:hypothetical protein
MKRPSKPDPTSSPAASFPDEDWCTLFPTVVEYLADGAFEDGEPRQLSTLGVKFQDGLILVTLSDHELSRGLYRTGATFLDALGAIEGCLVKSTADWRAWKKGGYKKS